MKCSRYQVDNFKVSSYLTTIGLLDFVAVLFTIFCFFIADLCGESVEYVELVQGLLWLWFVRFIYHSIFILSYNRMAGSTGGVEIDIVPVKQEDGNEILHCYKVVKIDLGSYLRHIATIVGPALIVFSFLIFFIISFTEMSVLDEGVMAFIGAGFAFALIAYPVLFLGHLSFVVTYNLIAEKFGGIEIQVALIPDKEFFPETVPEISVEIIDDEETEK